MRGENSLTHLRSGQGVGVLRLHVSRASRETHSAQDDRLYLASRNFLIGPSSIPQQTASVLPTSRPDLPIADSSTQSTQSSSSVSNPSIASRVQWPSERRQSFRNTPSGRNDTYWQTLRFHHACAPKLAGRCCRHTDIKRAGPAADDVGEILVFGLHRQPFFIVRHTLSS